ncbi:MAG: amidohydrolase [Nitrospirales bacterium]|nr:MAG: amidohydrolase [Nitrospirales bacterium]
MIVLSNIQTLYDGTSATQDAIQEHVDVWIDEGKIEVVQPHTLKRPKGPTVTRIDCSQYTVTPGLIDCHGHVTLCGVSRDNLERMSGPEGLIYAERILYTTLVNGGVTTMRDVGGATHVLKRLVDQGVIIGPRLKIAICMLSTTGGHADFLGPDRCCGQVQALWPPGPGRPSSIVDGPWACRKRVREIAACGGDLVKICASPGVVSPSDKLENRDFTAAEIHAICEEAAARGMYVAAHAHSQNGIALAIEHGVKDIQHISFMDEELAERAYVKGCTVTPTSWIGQSLTEADDLTPFVKKKVQQVVEVHSQAVKHAFNSGLNMLGGTDPILPGMHGRNYMELVSLMNDGVPALSAWHGMTGLAGDLVAEHGVGKIRAGAPADLLVCQANVVEQPLQFEEGVLLEVIKDGVAYRRGLPNFPSKTFDGCVAEALNVKT